jgi:hypothetical protein
MKRQDRNDVNHFVDILLDSQSRVLKFTWMKMSPYNIDYSNYSINITHNIQFSLSLNIK